MTGPPVEKPEDARTLYPQSVAVNLRHKDGIGVPKPSELEPNHCMATGDGNTPDGCWEKRGSQDYYYRKEREGSRVKAVCVGRWRVFLRVDSHARVRPPVVCPWSHLPSP